MDKLLATQQALLRVIRNFTATVIAIPDDKWTIGVVQARLELLNSYWTDFQSNHLNMIQSDFGDQGGYDQEVIYTEIERVYIESQSKLYDLRERLIPTSSGSRTLTGDETLALQRMGTTSARLPRMNVPTFSGQREDWKVFRDAFQALVHNDEQLSDVQRLFYLKSHVEGEAKLAVDTFSITEANYTAAWAMLVARYEHPRLLVQDHLNILRNLRPLKDDKLCEKVFNDHRRESDGRYVLRLPTRPDFLNVLGESFSGALATLLSLHRRMKRDPRMADAYIAFMNDYLHLGHMRQLTNEEMCNRTWPVNHIPHHVIWQRGDQASRLRVVFNASRSTSTGYSLNDVLLTGPKLQTHLWRVLIRWRQYSVAFCANVKMMYRQIRIDDRDVDLQRIVWSPGEEEPIQHFQLLTVTYGESCAPYLSLRVLQQLCLDEGERYKEAVNALTNERYIDDVLSGAENLESALHLRNQIIQLLNAGGFPLRKWIANDPGLLRDLAAEECLRPSCVRICEEGPVSELGLLWNPQSDNFLLTPPVIAASQKTMREILSAIAGVFDPCGWLAPVTVVAKMLMQDLWRARLNCDEELPASMARRWTSFKESLPCVSQVTLPRWIQTGPRRQTQLHAFSDASRRAMAAVVYVRVLDEDHHVSTALLAAKKKLNSIKSLQPSSLSEP